MTGPAQYDFINIHDHDADQRTGVFTIDNIMAHEDRYPKEAAGIVYSCGAHPWGIDEGNLDEQIQRVRDYVSLSSVVAVGEAGFDRIRGAGNELQEKAFSAQVKISEEHQKPLFIHCVKAWDELLRMHKEHNPRMRWIVHGFRGKPELAGQLLDKGFYLSPWVEWAIRPEAAKTLKTIPPARLFLETDGFDIAIEKVYGAVTGHLETDVESLKKTVYSNYLEVFGSGSVSKKYD